MAMKKVLLGVAFAPILWCAPMEAASKEIQLRVKYSGSATTTQSDTNHDGIKAGLGTVAGRSNLGPCTSQGRGEAVLAGPATCPNGNAGIKLTLLPGTGHSFLRFEKTGDLLFSEIAAESACHDPSTGMLFKSGTENITGGTGRFAGATGQLRFEGSQRLLYIDADGNAFAAQSGTVTGTIILGGE